ncbi:hypothetical protein DCE94_04680 [Agromyces badenianii]|nr:hypothetical protein DCE94_04680 [Agromyces badenianii]
MIVKTMRRRERPFGEHPDAGGAFPEENCGQIWRVSLRHGRVNHVDTTTTPLTLHPFTVADAERLLSGEVDPHDGWEGAYAFTDEPELLSEYLLAVQENGDPRPFGPYLVRRGEDGPAIGGVNLFGPPDDDGAVDFVFGLVPAVRGHGLAAHTVTAVVELSRAAGVSVLRAEAEVGNLPARQTLEKVGFAQVARTPEEIIYELRL